MERTRSSALAPPEPSAIIATRFSALKCNFLGLLLRDLRKIGFYTRIQKRGPTLWIIIDGSKRRDEQAFISRHDQHTGVSPVDHRFVKAALASGVSQSFASGAEVDACNINPSLQFCSTEEQFALFRFCRLLQSVAAPRLLYRQLAVIVRDKGQKSQPVIGIAGLTSPVYSLGCRDRLFGWTNTSRAIRNLGLLRTLQLGICMAVPPYTELRGAKLVAALAASREVADEYHRRYGSLLLAIVTTAARGLHTPIFNRIMLKPGGLYRRIGETTGYSALIFSDETVAAAKRLVIARDGLCPATTDRPIRVLKRAMNLCGIPRERFMRLGIRKGVYAAWPTEDALHALIQRNCTLRPAWPTAQEAILYWKERELSRMLGQTPHVCRFRRSGWGEVHQTIRNIYGDSVLGDV